jgi:hypothetical protein
MIPTGTQGKNSSGGGVCTTLQFDDSAGSISPGRFNLGSLRLSGQDIYTNYLGYFLENIKQGILMAIPDGGIGDQFLLIQFDTATVSKFNIIGVQDLFAIGSVTSFGSVT